MINKYENGKYTYEEIMDYVSNIYDEMLESMETCILPDTVDKEKVNELLIQARKMY